MAKKLHPKILELRNSVGYKPIYEFNAIRKSTDEKLKYRSPVIEEDESPRKIRQYFCIFGIMDTYRTRPMKGCFGKSISERGPKSDAVNKIVVLDQHRQFMPLCRPLVLKEDEIGLYGEYIPDEGITSNDDLVIRVKSGTINGGSYGFDYLWDKMEYNEKEDCIDMLEVDLFEVSPVTIPSQPETHVMRSKGVFDEDLQKQTDELIKKIPRKLQLEMRGLISRHISLAESQPDKKSKPTENKASRSNRKVDYKFLIQNF